jgi:hypothetical protein
LPFEAIEHRLPRRSHKSQCLPLTGLFAPPPRPWSLRPRPAPNLARMLLIYPDVDSSEHTPAPGLVPDRQITGFLFAYPHPVACPRWPICAQNVQDGLGGVSYLRHRNCRADR